MVDKSITMCYTKIAKKPRKIGISVFCNTCNTFLYVGQGDENTILVHFRVSLSCVFLKYKRLGKKVLQVLQE